MSLSMNMIELADYLSHCGLSVAIFLFPIINLKPVFLCGEVQYLCSIQELASCSSERSISIEEDEKHLTLLGYYYSSHYPLTSISYCYSTCSFSSVEVFVTKYYFCLYMIGVIIAECLDEKIENKKLLASITYVCIILFVCLMAYLIICEFAFDFNLIAILIMGGFIVRIISLLNKTLVMALSKTLNEIKARQNKLKHISIVLCLTGLSHLSLLLMLRHFNSVIVCYIASLFMSVVLYVYAYRLFPTMKRVKATSGIFYDSFIIKTLAQSTTNLSPTASMATYPLIPHSTSQESLLSTNTLLQHGRSYSIWSLSSCYSYFLYFLGCFSYNLYRNYFFLFFLYDNSYQHRDEVIFCGVLLFLTELVFHLIGETCFNLKSFLLFNSLFMAIICSIIEYGYKTKKNQLTLAMISILLFCLLEFHSQTKRSMKDNLMKEIASKEYLRVLNISSVFLSAFMINMVQATNMIMSLIYFTVFIINIKIVEKEKHL